MKQLLFLIMFLTQISYGQAIHKKHVPRQPYYEYNIQSENTGSITFYLSEFSEESYLPLIIYVQGSGNKSLFSKDSSGRITPKSGHISWAYEAKEKAKVLIIEKPGVGFTDQNDENKLFDNLFSVESWSNTIKEAILFVLKNEKIDTSKIMIVGHSEGGLIASKVARELPQIKNVAVLAGEGPSQLYSLYKLAESGEFFNNVNSSYEERIDSLTRVWKSILKDPLSVKQKFWGFTYLRWSSFLKTSVSEELSNYNGKILITQGDADKNVFPESAKILYTILLSKEKDVKLNIIAFGDHSFNITNNPSQNGWDEVVKNTITWFLEK